MPLSRFLPEFLQEQGTDEPEPDTDADADATVIHECRHCGTDFDDHRDRCPVCGATEIATYEFDSGDE